MQRYLGLGLGLFVVLVGNLQAADPFAEPDKKAAEFAKRLQKGDMKAVFEHLKSLATENFVEELDKLQDVTMKQRKELIIPRHGKPTGEVEQIERQAVGTSLAKYAYTERFEKSAIFWTIILYRSTDGWIVHDVKYTDKSAEFFQPRK